MDKNKLVGYTTGVFDMFHVGHLNILKRAKNNCDHLIVGVSTDELVQQYKNKKPVIPYSDRRDIIESIKYVDQVVPQTHRDKVAAYHELKFDVVFVGDDWKGDIVFVQLENELAKHGASVQYFEYTKEVSSTKFNEVLQALYDNEIQRNTNKG